ncbi:MAG: AtpZ/AtpI family protein [Calditrichota bacterium]
MLNRESWHDITNYSNLGAIIAASVLAGFFGGWWLDGKIGSKPILAIIGAFIGMAGGFVHLVRVLNQSQREKDNNSEDPDAPKH